MNSFDFSLYFALRRHLRIVHHTPGRIRLRIGATVFQDLKGVDAGLIDRVLGAIEGISDVRLNKMAGSVVINYLPARINPAWWEILLQGDEEQSTALLKRLMNTDLAPAVAAVRAG